MNEKNRIIMVDVISGLFVLLFVYAALSKVQDFEKFKVELGKSPVLNTFSSHIAIIVPSVELLVAVLLVIKKSQYVALYISFTLMVIFSTYIVVILKFSSYIPCSCGGVLENMTWVQHLFFNIGFVMLGTIAILIYPLNIKSLSAVRRKAFVPEIEGN